MYNTNHIGAAVTSLFAAEERPGGETSKNGRRHALVICPRDEVGPVAASVVVNAVDPFVMPFKREVWGWLPYTPDLHIK